MKFLRLKHLAVLLLFPMLWLASCHKDLPIQEPSETPFWQITDEALANAKKSLSKPEELQFFDFGHASRNNPHVVKSAEGRTDSVLLLNGLAAHLIKLNQQQPFLHDLVQRVGFPFWDKAIFPGTDNGKPAVMIPFAHLDVDSTQAFLVAAPIDSGNWLLQLETRARVDTALTPAKFNASVRFRALAFVAFDDAIFRKHTKSYWSLSQGFQEGLSANDRDFICFTVEMYVRCPIALSGGGSAEDRGCWVRTVETYCKEISGSPGGIGIPGGSNDPGGIPGITVWGVNDPGAVGSITPAFYDFWQQALLVNDPDQQPTLTPQEKVIARQLLNLYNTGIFTLPQLEVLFHNPILRQRVVQQSETSGSNTERQQVTGIIVEAVRRGGITPEQAVKVFDLANTLGLDPLQTAWLASRDVHIDPMINFLANNNNSQDAKDHLKEEIAKMMANGEYDHFVESTYSWGEVIWEIAIELVGDALIDIILDKIPGFGQAQEIKDIIKGIKNDDWFEVTKAIGELVFEGVLKNHPALSAIKAVWEGSSALVKIGKSMDKVGDLVNSIGTQAAERAWNIVSKMTNIDLWKIDLNKYLKYADKLQTPKIGRASRLDWAKTYEEEFPDINMADIHQVHHAVPRASNYRDNMLGEYEVHSIENLRGIPKSHSQIHGQITGRWTAWYNTKRDPVSGNYVYTMSEALDFAKSIDDEFGHLFVPPIR